MARINPFNDNLAFQPKGTDQEARIGVEKAVEAIRAYCAGGSDQGVLEALNYVEDRCPKTERICDDIRNTLLLDFDQNELKQQLCVRAFNQLANRLNGKPI